MVDRGQQNLRRIGRRSFVRAIGLGATAPLSFALGGCTLTDLFGVEGTGDVPPPPAVATAAPPATGGDLLQVDAVEVLILESFPVQVNVVVRGAVPDACTEIGEIAQQRIENEIEVTIMTTRDPAAFCAQVLTPVEETIALAGDFPPGEYTVTVNGMTEMFRV